MRYSIQLFLILTIILAPATVSSSAQAGNSLYINEIMAGNASSVLNSYTGNFSDWIEIHNPGTMELNLEGYWLSDDLDDPLKWQLPPASYISAKGFLLIWADSLDVFDHANFSLSMEGGEIVLLAPDGTLLDQLSYEAQKPDISYGRMPDGGETLQFFADYSPLAPNSAGLPHSLQSDIPIFSEPGGFFESPVNLELSSPLPVATIRYTLDGSIPDETAPEYTDSILIEETTVVRARVYGANLLPSDVLTNTYFLNEPSTSLPIFSLSTNPDFLFDDDIGIYAFGRDFEEAPPYYGANFWYDWERPVHVEYFGPEGNRFLNFSAGIGIFGGATVAAPQKSLAIYARDKYGQDGIEYSFYEDKPITFQRRFVLRNSGNDWALTMFRDAFQQSLAKGRMDVDAQAYQPAVVYLNGVYWGIQNIREKIDGYYPESNYGFQRDEVDVLDHNVRVLAGDSTHYDALLDYLESNDISQDEHYQYVKTRMEIDEYINYQIFQIYIANADWPGANLKLWRPRTETGRWRWILFDTDLGYDLWFNFSKNMIAHATDPDSSLWSNPPESTYLFRTLLENSEFRNEFIQRYAAYLNTAFEPSRALAVLETFPPRIQEEIPRHSSVWGGLMDGFLGYFSFSSEIEWLANMEEMRRFAQNRPQHSRSNFISHFNLSGTSTVSLSTFPSGAGTILTHDISLPSENFTGLFFLDTPLRLQAVPNPGYRFSGWQGTMDSTELMISPVLEGDAVFTAVFEKVNPVPVVINEIHYNPSPQQGDDELYEFIELYNAGLDVVDLSGFSFTDGIEFTFPEGASIAPQEFIVIAVSADSYSGNIFQVFQWTDGRLGNGGERIELQDPYQNVIDEVEYDDLPPWPTEPDARGPSLSLISPFLDNSLPDNWLSSQQFGGTPGLPNHLIPLGDSNADGRLTVTDLMILLLFIKGSLGYGEPPLLAPADTLDVNQDGYVDGLDGTFLAQLLAEKPEAGQVKNRNLF